MSDELTVMLGFDMETDIGSWTPYYEGLVHGTPLMLEVLARRKIAGTCYFVGQAAKDHPNVVRDCQSAGHEIGCHSLYHETVGKPLFPIPNMRELLDHEIEPRIRLATEWVQDVAGARPVSFRCPRLFGSTAVCNALERLGYTSDATYPMYHYGRPLTPYHPSRADWTQVGDSTLIVIPNFANLSMTSSDPYGRDRDQWPLFRTDSAAAFLRCTDGFIAACRAQGKPVVLGVYMHPWEFWPMPDGPIHFGEGAVLPDEFLVKNCGPYAVQQFEILLDELINRGARFVPAAQCAKEWQERGR